MIGRAIVAGFASYGAALLFGLTFPQALGLFILLFIFAFRGL